MGLEGWWKLLLQINFSQILKCIRMGQSMLCSRLGHKPKLVLCQEEETRKAMKDGVRRNWDGKSGQKSLYSPKFSTQIHKTSLWG
jgi:hypothetical protein